MIWLTILPLTQAFLCGTLNVGTDADSLSDIINGGSINPAWDPAKPTYRISPAQSEFYIYVEGLEFIGPELSVSEFHSDDEKEKGGHKWLDMNVTEDDEEAGLLEKIKVYRIEQDCLQDEGGVSIVSNLTLTSSFCNPLTIGWIKSCGEPNVARWGFNVGFSETSSELVKDGVVNPMFDGNTKKDIFTVSNDDDFTELYVYMTDEVGAKVFMKAPYIVTDHEIVSPIIDGPGSVSGWVDTKPQLFTISYACHVSKGSRGEIALIIELPYFHDIEIHFFKQCGTKKKKAAAFSYAKTFFVLAGLSLLGISVYSFYKWYVDGVNFWDAVPMGRQLEQVWLWVKEKLGIKKQPSMRDERDLPDEDDGKAGFNVHTSYGSI